MPTKNLPPIDRACETGDGHIQRTDGRYPERDPLRCDRSPSRSLAAPKQGMSSGLMQSRDIFLVTVGGRRIEVGKAVYSTLPANPSGVVMAQDFCVSGPL